MHCVVAVAAEKVQVIPALVLGAAFGDTLGQYLATFTDKLGEQRRVLQTRRACGRVESVLYAHPTRAASRQQANHTSGRMSSVVPW